MNTPTPDSARAWDALVVSLRAIADAEGGPMFMGWPERWYDGGFLRRCTNDHVSKMTLKSEALRRDACLARGCGYAPVHITFPEDRDGPLVYPVQNDGSGAA